MSIVPDNLSFSADAKAALESVLPTINRDQALWLNGYSAALIGGSAAPAAIATPAQKVNITVAYGTESGNAEQLAARVQKEAKKQGITAKLLDLADATPENLKKIENLLLIISTWGEGDPPERATEFYQALMSKDAPKLDGINYTVCGLGDTSYEHFCKMGKDFDKRFEELGGKRIADRVDCDVDYEAPFVKWMGNALGALKPAAPSVQVISTAPVAAGASAYDKSNPFPSELLEKINLNGTGSLKETIHAEFSLEGSGLNYKVGDALGLVPSNADSVVDEVLKAGGFNGSEEVNGKTLREALKTGLDCTGLSKKVMQEYAKLAGSAKLDELLKKSAEVKEYTWGREIVDLLEDYPVKGLKAEDLVGIMRKLPARLYSIASSPKAHEGEVHLTVGAVRYESHGRTRGGVCSTFLADRLAIGETAPVYMHANKNFALPEDNETPIIMVGPGTGIAPFRAFVEERAAVGAKGQNWLFFGDQRYSYDFLYQLEWQDYLKDGVLTKLDVAFSRDQPEKYYVQDVMKERGKELFAWLEEGAHFYVCGDASRMAKDVNQALMGIVSEHGGMDAAAAKKYVSALIKAKRYQKDVY